MEEKEGLSLDLQNLKPLCVLGRGAKGVVFLVNSNQPTLNDRTVALKTISKVSIQKKQGDGFKRILFERDVLQLLDHPLLPNLIGLVDTHKILGFVMQYCSGGSLNNLRKGQREKMFSDEIIRFYAAELVLALEYLHGLGIVYRDLKPENILIQENGHLMLVDFDLSAKLVPQTPEKIFTRRRRRSENLKKKSLLSLLLCSSNTSRETSISSAENSVNTRSDCSTTKSNSFVGTEDYVAPEIIEGEGHDFSVDWWSLGVVLYEMLYGFTPFRGTNRKETFFRILTKTPDLTGEETPLRDLIRKLLEKDPSKRITVESIKDHEFFRGVHWDRILEICRPPFIPTNEHEGGTQGNPEIDVEKFVDEVFNKHEIDLDKDNKKSVDHVHWVDGLSKSNPSPTEFQVF